jgi:glycine/D-amino acid oxidase-like deaminating enzyme
METKPKTVVIGAGMVGTCCALYLQNEGHDVTLLDRGGPGEATSSGNLGGFGIASCPPAAMPGILKKVPGMLFDAQAPLRLRWTHMAKALPWFMRFIANSRRDRVEANAAARQCLLDQAHDAFDPLVAEASAQHLMSQTGLMFTFESEATFQGASYAFDLRRRNGVQLDLLDGNEARQVHPALSDKVVRAYRVPNFSHTADPLRLVQALAALFERRGGQILRRTVHGCSIGPEGARSVNTDEGELAVDNVVVAAGVWSRKLALDLGTNVPLEAERGYHTMFHGTDVRMNGAILSVDRYVAITPMLDGIRVGGVAEFAAPDAAPNFEIAKMVRRHGQALFPGLKNENTSEWMGPRPSHPDSKPVIERSPHHRNVYFAFGHDHLGLTMGGITGKLISELVTGRTPSVDLTPFRSDRF